MSTRNQIHCHKNKRTLVMLKVIIGILILFQPTFNAKADDAPVIDGATCQAMVDQVKKIMPKGVPDPYDNKTAQKLFDIHSYFTVLNLLKIYENYELDYIYCALFRYGHPYIYKRVKRESPYDLRTACAILKDIAFQPDAAEQMTKSYMQVVYPDGSPASLIQFAILYLIGDQFFLFDHGGYDDDILIFTKSKLSEILNVRKDLLPDDVKTKALKIDVTPIFGEDEERSSVKVITFSKCKGFQQHTFVFDKLSNYFCMQKDVETLVPYESKRCY